MKQIPIDQAAALIATQLPKGIFLCTGGDTPNVMTIGWGGLSYYWQKNIFTAPIRPQRHTHPLLQREKAFTLSIPASGTMQEALMKAGTLSGRDGDKFQAAGLRRLTGAAVDAPVIAGCALYLECKVLAQADFTQDKTDASIIQYTYQAGDFHTLFFGEIVACYAGE